jgi:hypothetical protein
VEVEQINVTMAAIWAVPGGGGTDVAD